MNNKKILILSSRQCGEHHVSYNTILGCENEFLMSDEVDITYLKYSIYEKALHKFTKSYSFSSSHKKIRKKIHKINPKACFVSAMGFEELNKFANTLSKIDIPIIVFCYDTWESNYNEWEKAFDTIKPTYIICTYKKSVEYFSQKYKNVYCVQQSMDKTIYKDYHNEKTNLFMQMGRRNECLHKMVLAYLKKNLITQTKENYNYQQTPGKILFENAYELAENINKTRFFVTAPQNKNNSAKTGNISEVTARFFECMACKSLIVGFKPQDSFDDLFPYENAMIEINENGSNFEEKINFYLNNEEKYSEIVERNYSYVMNHHTWTNRLDEIMRICNL